jgi:gas vesicle protein
LDDLFNFVGFVGVRNGHIQYAGRFYSHSIGDRIGRGADSLDPGSQAGSLKIYQEVQVMINNGKDTQATFGGIGNNLLYLLVGGGIGATVALLFAPKSGKELRQDASEAVKYGLETANTTVSHLKETADDYYQKAQEKASEFYHAAMKTVNGKATEADSFAGKKVGNPSPEFLTENNPANQSPMFESGRKPFDQRNIKTGIL